MAVNPRIERRRREFQQYKQDVASRGKPFHPYAMLHDTVMSLVVVAVIVGLAILWKFTAAENHHGAASASGILGTLYDNPADPGTINFVPRPDWYFYFLFYLLRIFKWPETVFLATIGIPTICLVLLFALPFMDLRAERRLLRRPVALVAAILVVISMGVLTYKGATAKEALASELIGEIPTWQHRENLPKAALPGAKLFAESGCLNCHTYLGTGSPNLGAPNLSAIGSKNLGIDFQIRHLKCPSCVNPGSPMPSFAAYKESQLHDLAVFLEASKGG
ncbi:MAG TPA: c-type cytochrome [Gaiellaceae bacterium]|nr:c-type cytochrome [Gaiellaceae bacterium]